MPKYKVVNRKRKNEEFIIEWKGSFDLLTAHLRNNAHKVKKGVYGAIAKAPGGFDDFDVAPFDEKPAEIESCQETEDKGGNEGEKGKGKTQ